MPTISIVVPLYNESDNLQLLYDRLNRVMARMEVSYEYVWVNDGSRDDTMSVVRRLAQGDSQLKYLELSRNFGHQIAVTAGLEHSTGDCIVIIDADLQDPPELIVDLYAKMRQGYDVVYAKRRSREGESWLKK
ncbi:MAG: glycosyltransferase family 2 protein, partial [Bacteroidota bacterium]